MKEDLRIRRTRKLLIDSLTALMREKPFEKISVVDICERAMVHRSTFYAHFEDKYQLLRYIMEDFENAFEREDTTENDFDGYRQYYLAVAEDIIDDVDRKKDLLGVILKKNKHESIIESSKRILDKKIYDKLKKCEENGMKLMAPAKILSSFYSGACMSLLEWWIENPAENTREDIIEYLDILIPRK